MDTLLIHSAVVYGGEIPDKKINFTGGSATFTVGATITGSLSHATAKVKTITRTLGSWGSGNASGYLILSNVTGTFQTSDVLTDSGTPPGYAIMSGPQDDYLDDYKVPLSTTSTTSTIRCRFTPSSSLKDTISGERYISIPRITVLPSTVLTVGSLIAVFGGTYRITAVIPVYDASGLHHYRCDLEAVS